MMLLSIWLEKGSQLITDRSTGNVITPTIFPDHTSQIWKLAEYDNIHHPYDIWWTFENEAEVMHLLQLFDLLTDLPYVVIPYMPYARQDKEISNTTTFAQRTFVALMEQFFPSLVITFDIHSDHNFHPLLNAPGISLINVSPLPAIMQVIERDQPDMIIYPDSGAYERLKGLNQPFTTLQKERDPLTGHIHHMRCPMDLNGQSVLLVDDIIDGGATFLRAAAACYEAHASSVSLYASHGLFTKGVSIFHDAGIERIYTTDSTLGRFVGVEYISIDEFMYKAIEETLVKA